VTFVPRTYAERNANGVWDAWLEFHPIDAFKVANALRAPLDDF
jgi:hypothetical protein